MSTAVPQKPRSITHKSHITIVASQYNEQFTQPLIENTRAELQELAPNSRIELILVPGSFEIPATVSAILAKGTTHIVIALGLIIRGQTQHGDLIAQSITNSLQDLAVQYAKPIIHEVLLVDDEKQAYARCIGSHLNRGREAARSAVMMSQLFQQIAPSDLSSKTRPNLRQYPSNA